MEGKMEGRNIKKRVKKYHWLIALITTVFVSMWIYGTTRVYFPVPLYIGFGQYLDLSVGIIIVTLFLSGFIVAVIFKKEKRR